MIRGMLNQIEKWIFLLALALTLSGCALNEQAPCTKDGNKYGVLDGRFFRGAYWDHYEKALSYMEGMCWEQAEFSLRQAIKQRSKDQRGIQTRDLMYIDYYPHRELGIIYYFEGEYEDAKNELEQSAKDENKSGRTKHYLNLVKKALILQQKQDVSPPEIIIHSPRNNSQSNDFTVLVKGTVKDDTYVEKVSVNGLLVQLTPTFSFQVDVHLYNPGENVITIEAWDVFGNRNVKKLSIFLNVLSPKSVTEKSQEILHDRLFASLENWPLIAQNGNPKPVIEIEGWNEKNDIFWAEDSLKININDKDVQSVLIYKNGELYLKTSPQSLAENRVRFRFDFGENSIRIVAKYNDKQIDKTFYFYRKEYQDFLPAMAVSLVPFDEHKRNGGLEEYLLNGLSEKRRFRMIKMENIKEARKVKKEQCTDLLKCLNEGQRQAPPWAFEWSFEERESVIGGKSESKPSEPGRAKQPSEKPRQGYFLDMNINIVDETGRLIETLSAYDEHEKLNSLRENIVEKIVSQLEQKLPRAEGVVQGIGNDNITVTLDNHLVKKGMRLLMFDKDVTIRGEAVIRKVEKDKTVAEIQGTSREIREGQRVVTR
jgi:hypothetical protein